VFNNAYNMLYIRRALVNARSLFTAVMSDTRIYNSTAIGVAGEVQWVHLHPPGRRKINLGVIYRENC